MTDPKFLYPRAFQGRPGPVAADQKLTPSSDRRNVVELDRARRDRERTAPRPQPPCDCEGD